MGFFSNLFTAVTQPIVNTVAHLDTTVHAVTETIDQIAQNVGGVVSNVPVIGPVADEFVFQTDLWTDLADTTSSVFSTTTALTQVAGGAFLDLDGALAGAAISADLDAFGQQINVSGDTLAASLASIFDFG